MPINTASFRHVQCELCFCNVLPIDLKYCEFLALIMARTLYSWRHFYATQDLERGVSTHALSRQLGNSTEMIDRHYSKYSPLLNAEAHSGRKQLKAANSIFT